jgi:parallel beta-helix repeat protein
MPWGDGVVDVQDLIVLAEHLTTDVNNNTATVERIIYVDADAVGANDGSSWIDAYVFLKDALADANTADKPVEIRVAQGIYKPDQGANQIPGDRKATLRLIDGVVLKGGFAGFSEPDPNAWDVGLYETILSGDLAGNDVEVDNPEDLFLEPSRLENSRHVLTLPSNILTATLDGFTVSGGNPHESGPFGEGGGLNTEGGLLGKLENANSKITVRHCTFSRNSAAFGGGVYIHGGSPTLVDCTFNCNYRGMLISECNVTLINCKFSGNSGGLGIINSSSSMLTDCTFTGNSARGLGITLSNVILTNCTFTNNSATERGGGFQITHESNATLLNCTFAGNSATYGGGMYNRYGSIASLINCTFAENSAQRGTGLYNDHCCDEYGFWSSASLTNCILWGGENEIYSEDESMLEITYSDVKGGWPGVGNIDIDPLFADPNNGDYHLKSRAGRYDPNTQSWIQDDVTSPCIDAGDPNSLVAFEPFPNGSIINMGAFGGTAEASKSP